MQEQVPRVVVGMDPHKRSVTIEVMTADETVLDGGRFDTSVEDYAAMLEPVAAWPERVWAIEGYEGIGRHIAHRLIADGQDVVDVPAKLSARARVFATGQGRKTDATDAHSVALVGTRMAGLRPVVTDEQLEVLQPTDVRKGSASGWRSIPVAALDVGLCPASPAPFAQVPDRHGETEAHQEGGDDDEGGRLHPDRMVQGRGQRHSGLDAEPCDGHARLMIHLGIIPPRPVAVAPGPAVRRQDVAHLVARR